MEETKEVLQFDSSLGGKENLPNEVHLLKFAAARCKEIAAMTECIMNPCSSKLVFQTLPVHMRRRIMSHNSKRLPRRLRAAYEAQLAKSGQPLKLKRPSRKYRRRPRNLLNEYYRRMRKHIWLETHIWHAKRFHMIEKWGYKLPLAPCDRAYRACYRATSKHCLLQDVSYYPSIQITGSLEKLTAGFKRITSNQCGLSITSQAYLSGKRAGSSYIFHIDKYPMKCIGKITFVWRSESNTSKVLWVFIHPSYYKELLDTLIECFNLILSNDEYDVPMKRLKLNEGPNENVNVPKLLNKIYKSNKDVTLIEMKDSINRFRLTGPLSHAILSTALTPLTLDTKDNAQNDSNWFKDICQNITEKSIHEIQSKFWCKVKNLKSPSELPCHLIVGLNVKDPRVNFPQKRTKAQPNDISEINVEDLICMPDNLSHSHLWNTNIRNKVSNKIITTAELNKLRENHSLVPGEHCSILDSVPGVPVLLIQRPGSQNSQYKRIGYNSGWDIIVPAGYGMAFWLSMVLRGARVGGLRETSKTAFESGNSDCNMQPDTAASQTEEMENSKVLLNKYFRLPPNKRVNYNKLSINSPFLCRWQTLSNDWMSSDKIQDFIVIRDKSILKTLQEMISSKKIIQPFNWDMNALVPVKLLPKNKGKLSDFGLICLPNSKDTISKKSAELLEPLKKDLNQKTRQNLRKEHKLELTKLRRRRVRLKRKLLEKSEKFVEVPKQNNSELNESYASKMRELWLPSHVDNVRHQCSRETMGYITHGDFSFTEAKGYGVGYVALPSIKNLVQISKGKQCLVLTRNTKSKQYRFATIDVITEY